MNEDIDDSCLDYSDWEQSQTFCQALDGDHTSSLDMWRWVAAGKWDIETKVWCQEVAKRLLDEDNAPDWKRRPDAVLKAVGLSGKANRLREIDEICLMHMTLKNLDVPEKRGDMVKHICQELKTKNLVRVSTEEIKKLVYVRISKLRKQHPFI